MRTLAEFKRAIHTGMEIELVRMEERPYSDELRAHAGDYRDVVIAEKLRGPRYVSYVDTTGFYLKRSDDKSIKGSFCGFPKAAQLAYSGPAFIITEVDSRGDEFQKRHYKIVIK